VLQAALAAGLALRSACRNGTCRACLSRLLAGEIRYVIEWPGVSAEEKAEGYFLPCVACPQTDIVMETVST
jgi:ferredoxin